MSCHARQAEAKEPPLQLKGFRKVSLKAKKSIVLTFVLGGRDLSIFDVEMGGWVQVRGDFVASIGGGLSALEQHVTFTN